MRRKNLVRPEQMPFVNITNKILRQRRLSRVPAPRGEDASTSRRCARARRAGEPDGRKIGVGLAIFCEQGAHGTSVYPGWGIPMVPGFEQATARLTPDGGLELRVGVHSHGQGLETTLAQIANEVLGIAPRRVKLVHGDTALTPYSTGTWGSRCAVMAGGAVGDGLRDARPDASARSPPICCRPSRRVDRAGRRHGAVRHRRDRDRRYRQASGITAPQNLPADVDPRRAGGHRKATRPCATPAPSLMPAMPRWSRSTPKPATIEILDYVIVEDGGMLINPMVVDGQVYGGAAQGIGTALYEEMPYDDSGQPLAATFADYHLPGAPRSAGDPHRSHGEPVADQPLRPEGHRRGRRDRPARGDRQRRQRRAGAARRRGRHLPMTPGRLLVKLPLPNRPEAGAGRMKPVAFDYAAAERRWRRRARCWREAGGAKPIAGGQSLGPMLNLRLARPAALVDVSRARRHAHGARRAATRHLGGARHPRRNRGRRRARRDAGLAGAVARHIAYRAVRNRGTIGGSLAHADPAADWVNVLTALGATRTGRQGADADAWCWAISSPGRSRPSWRPTR